LFSHQCQRFFGWHCMKMLFPSSWTPDVFCRTLSLVFWNFGFFISERIGKRCSITTVLLKPHWRKCQTFGGIDFRLRKYAKRWNPCWLGNSSLSMDSSMGSDFQS
jgi:hypothetical protein